MDKLGTSGNESFKRGMDLRNVVTPAEFISGVHKRIEAIRLASKETSKSFEVKLKDAGLVFSKDSIGYFYVNLGENEVQLANIIEIFNLQDFVTMQIALNPEEYKNHTDMVNLVSHALNNLFGTMVNDILQKTLPNTRGETYDTKNREEYLSLRQEFVREHPEYQYILPL